MRSQPEWKRYGYASYESYISSKAGASPPMCTQRTELTTKDDWPMPKPPPFAADDEDKEHADA